MRTLITRFGFHSSFILLVILSGPTQAAQSKYGKNATPLSSEHSSFQNNQHPDFWSLMPYYLHQRDGGSCSLASMTMVMNAFLDRKKMNANDSLFTQDSLLSFSEDNLWKVNLKTKGMTLSELKSSAESVLKKAGLTQMSVLTFQPTDNDATSLNALRKILTENEKSNSDFVIINYLQGIITGDSPVGHLAPIAAYDSKKKRVLILDPDREWYQPYWTSDEALLQAMTTIDPISKANRGLLWIKKL